MTFAIRITLIICGAGQSVVTRGSFVNSGFAASILATVGIARVTLLLGGATRLAIDFIPQFALAVLTARVLLARIQIGTWDLTLVTAVQLFATVVVVVVAVVTIQLAVVSAAAFIVAAAATIRAAATLEGARSAVRDLIRVAIITAATLNTATRLAILGAFFT